MNSFTKNIKLLLSLVLLTPLILLGCSDNLGQNSDPKSSREHLVSFSVQVPKAASGGDEYFAHESDIKEIVLLLFDSEGKYVYHPIRSRNFVTNPQNSAIKSFTASIPEGTYNNIVILANAEVGLGKALNDPDSPLANGQTKAQVLGKIEIGENGKWSIDPAESNYKEMPMWGEVPTLTINETSSKTIEFSLVRMLARVDVISKKSKTNLLLKEVYLYNYNDRGFVGPTVEDWTTTPSIPAEATKNKTALIFDDVEGDDEVTWIKNQIYTFESASGTSAKHLENTCIVVGGSYDNGETTYYRVDFGRRSPSGDSFDYINLLRNTYYEIDIKSVSGPGLPTPEEAFNSREVHLSAEVLAWTNTNLSEIVVDGVNKFGVSQSQFSLPQGAVTTSSTVNKLSVTTSEEGGELPSFIRTILNE